MTPTFTVVIGSAGRPSLKTTLDSVARQDLRSTDQCLVGIDSRRMPYEEINRLERLVQSYGVGFVAEPYTGIAAEDKTIPENAPGGPAGLVRRGEPYSWLGVEQINHMMRTVPMTGSHVMTVGDDDVFVDSAYATLRHICSMYPLQPVIFRFQAPNGWILWDKPRLAPCLISGCCVAMPNAWNGYHPTDIETTHDYRWIEAGVNLAKKSCGYSPLWLDFVGVIARPPRLTNGDVAHRGVWTCPRNCDFTKAWGHLELGKPGQCPHCKADLWADDEVMIVNEVEG